MSIKLKDSRLWKTERDRGPGKPYKAFELKDAAWFDIHALHVYKDGLHWNWVYWDIAKHDHRPPAGRGFSSPERAAMHVILHLVAEAAVLVERLDKLMGDHE